MPEIMLTADNLGLLPDLSAANLYRAEVRRIPLLTREEQIPYVDAARNGDDAAQHALVINCLNWTMRRASAIYRDQAPQHSDVMDLVGHANVSMLDALPFALRADDPTSYLMTVSAAAMRRYCAYKDPLIERPRDRPLSETHHTTVSAEQGRLPLMQTLAAPAIRLASYEQQERLDSPEYQVAYQAIHHLSRQHQAVVIAHYGLFGHPAMKNQDIADMLGLTKQTVEKYLWRAKRRLATKLAACVMGETLSGE